MRLTLVISDLSAGGAERVMTILANHWVSAGHEVHVVSQYGRADDPPFFPLSRAVCVDRLAFESVAETALPKTVKITQLARMRRAIQRSQPELIVSFMDTVNVRTTIAALGIDTPVVVAEHCDPHVRLLPFPWEFLRAWAYRRAAAVVGLSQEALEFFPQAIRARGWVIPNPVLPLPADVAIPVRKPAGAERGTLVSIGRLHDVKGFDLLIESFSILARSHSGWRLDIWGEGPARPSLESLIRSRGLHAVRLCGATDKPLEKLLQADMFVMSSRTEGFPMALGEAMAAGLPCVSFDCRSGPRQLIRHDVDGLLVPDGDVAALASAIARLIDEPHTRVRLGDAAKDVTARFSLPRVAEQWDSLFSDALRSRPLGQMKAACLPQ